VLSREYRNIEEGINKGEEMQIFLQKLYAEELEIGEGRTVLDFEV
jgi:hypothetical protein